MNSGIVLESMRTDHLNPHQDIRESAILYALFVLPGVLAPGDVSLLAEGIGAIIALIVRNGAFALLLLYIGDIRDRRLFEPTEKKLSVPYAIGIALILFILSILIGAIGRYTGVWREAVFSSIIPEATDPLRWIAIVLLMVSVAGVEELFFRGYLIPQFRRIGASRELAIIASAILFAVGHGYQGPLALVFSFSAGVFLGIFWVRRPNLISLIAGHAVYNTIALVLAG